MSRPVSYRTCAICSSPTISPWSPYCARCRGHLYNRPENAKRRAALVEAYDRDLDGFRCRYSRAPLEEDDQDSPFYLVFDHELPPRTSKLVACAAVFNMMKGQMTPDEFRRAVRELAAHKRGKPFNRGAVTIHYWTQRMPPRPGARQYREEWLRIRLGWSIGGKRAPGRLPVCRSNLG